MTKCRYRFEIFLLKYRISFLFYTICFIHLEKPWVVTHDRMVDCAVKFIYHRCMYVLLKHMFQFILKSIVTKHLINGGISQGSFIVALSAIK